MREICTSGSEGGGLDKPMSGPYLYPQPPQKMNKLHLLALCRFRCMISA